ncbi:MAG: DNA mismatch repair endonuclease MutL [Ktedonobacteraceae bacterium]
MPIRQLAADVAAKIAAGEVVERPASVVKELIENSIDAGATQIRVDLLNGGLQLMRVIDNGSGISAGELQLALARHATSKVEVIDDLEHIRSLGFRGEALASIAAVADVTLLSRHRDADQGAQINALNGQISKVSTAASPEGTTLTVRNLFSAVPARLKFLKSRNSEVSHCLHMLEQYALAYPEIRFSVFSEGRQIFSTAGDGQLSSVLIEVYGLQVAEQMVPISSLDGRDDEPERPVASGYISLPGCYKSTRQHISFFVNRRWVLSRMLTVALEEAYHSLLLAGRHPIAVVNISLDPTLLDVNVHPAKTEIRFLKERRVYAAVLRAVRGALLEEATMPEWGDGNRAGTGSRDTIPQGAKQGAINRATATAGLAPTMSEDDADQILPEDNPWLTVAEEETGTKPPILSRLWQSHVSLSAAAPVAPTSAAPRPGHPQGDAPTMDEAPPQGTLGGEATHDTPQARPSMVGVPFTGTLVDARTLGSATGIPRLRVIGQLAQSYIVAEGPDGTGMYLVDQHAAHERILLERMVAALKARTPISQMLLTPIQLELAPQELEAIEDHLPQLEQIGFALAILNNKMLSVQAVPNVLVKQMNARSLHELLTDLTVPENRGHTETWEEHALANVACKAAIKAHYFLTVSEMREMIEQLEQTNAPYSCCHGRPTMVHFSLSTLEREFGRR